MILSLKFWSKIVFPNWTLFFIVSEIYVCITWLLLQQLYETYIHHYVKNLDFEIFFFFFLSNHFIYYSISSTISKFHISMFVFLSYWCFWVICLETRKNSHSKIYISLFAKFTHFLFFFSRIFLSFHVCYDFFFVSSARVQQLADWDEICYCFVFANNMNDLSSSQLVLNNKV